MFFNYIPYYASWFMSSNLCCRLFHYNDFWPRCSSGYKVYCNGIRGSMFSWITLHYYKLTFIGSKVEGAIVCWTFSLGIQIWVHDRLMVKKCMSLRHEWIKPNTMIITVKYWAIKLKCQVKIITNKYRIICKVCKVSKERVEA